MRSILLSLTVLSVTAAAGQQVSLQRDVQQILSTKVAHYSLKAANLLQATAQIASDFGLQIGVEWQGDPASRNDISRQWDDTTVERILYDTATFDIQYQVGVSNNVVHLRKVSLADSPRNPLNLTAGSFSVSNEYSRAATLKLRDQVNQILFPREQGKRIACGGSYGVSADETLVTLSMENATVREIMDALLVKSRFAMWLIVFRSEQPNTGFLRTKSIWHNTTDSQEPDWQFLSRYDDPTTGKYRSDWKLGIGR